MIRGPSSALRDIQMLNLKKGFAVGDSNTLLRTTDGGISWDQIGITVTYDYFGVFFLDTLKGFAAGSEGHVLKTTDGGNSWYVMNMYTASKALRWVSYTGPDTGFVVGDAGYLMMTTNGGNTWSSPACRT